MKAWVTIAESRAQLLKNHLLIETRDDTEENRMTNMSKLEKRGRIRTIQEIKLHLNLAMTVDTGRVVRNTGSASEVPPGLMGVSSDEERMQDGGLARERSLV